MNWDSVRKCVQSIFSLISEPKPIGDDWSNVNSSFIQFKYFERMDSLIWLLGSWLFVGLICYIFILKVSEPKPIGDNSSNDIPSRLAATSKSGEPITKEWINPIIEWLFKITHHTPAPLMAWICALNDASRRLNNPDNCEVLFEDFGNHTDLKAMPKLSDVRVEKGPGEHLTLKTKISVPLVVVRLVASQKVKDRLAVTNYDAHICDLYGEIEARIACIAGEIYLMSCFNGRPEMEIVLQDREPHKHVELNEQVVSEAIRRCIVSAVTNINLSQHEREVGEYQLRPDANASPIQEMVKRLSTSYTPSFSQQRTSNKLYVKIIRADTLGANQAVHSPYVVVEMDEPIQKYATSKQSTSYPYWDEEFVFDLNPASDEILLEVYDDVQDYVDSEEKFLGLSIVSFKEIPPSGDSIQTLPLSTRPYRNDKVSGNLVVQFKFYHDPNVPIIGSETHEIFVTNGEGAKFRENQARKRQQIDKIYDIHDDDIRFTPTKTTTLLVKTMSQDTNRSVPPTHDRIPLADHESEDETDDIWRVQKSQFDKNIPITRNETMPDEPVPYITPRLVPPYQPSKTVVPPYHPHTQEGQPPDTIIQGKLTSSPVIKRSGSGRDTRESRAEAKEDERSRKSKKRDHSFFEELRRRLSGSRGKQRAKSVDLENKHMEEAYASLPASRDSSRTRPSTDGRELSAARSLGGEVTGKRSTLIYEVYKGGENKYYQVPPAVASDPEALKLLGRGKKLHVHNGHSFVAVKTKGGVSCNTCNSRIASSFHKQAYQCRDCRYICHKSCHADTLAPCQHRNADKLKMA
uniref:Uncharacterized protein n=1 Tax=Acrobeloides nanus TaxID=290746 RepID=A0A914CAK8_9BILA